MLTVVVVLTNPIIPKQQTFTSLSSPTLNPKPSTPQLSSPSGICCDVNRAQMQALGVNIDIQAGPQACEIGGKPEGSGVWGFRV